MGATNGDDGVVGWWVKEPILFYFLARGTMTAQYFAREDRKEHGANSLETEAIKESGSES